MRHVLCTICIQLPRQKFRKIIDTEFLKKYTHTNEQFKERQIHISMCVYMYTYIYALTHTQINNVLGACPVPNIQRKIWSTKSNEK